jgi:hypothetical protein
MDDLSRHSPNLPIHRGGMHDLDKDHSENQCKGALNSMYE